MNTTYRNMKQDNPQTKDFLALLIPKTENEKLEFEAKMIQLDFISRLQELMKYRNIKSKKELAELLGTSPSFISQIFSGEKLINLKHIAKIQKALNVKYAIISNLYLRHKNSFRGNLASKGFHSLKITLDDNMINSRKKTA